MWQPINLSLTNFLSHSQTNVKFDLADNKPVVIAIYGENRTAEGADSNGSGKSSIIDALMFALTGTTARGIANADLVKTDNNAAQVNLALFNSQLNSTITIERVIRIGKSATIAINQDKQPVICVDINEYNKWILEKLGIDKADLINYFLVNNSSTETFFKLGDAGKKRLINRFLNLDPLTLFLQREQKYQKECERNLALIANAINDNEKKIIHLQGLAEIAKLKIENAHNSKVEALKVKIEFEHNKADSINNSIHSLRNDLNNCGSNTDWSEDWRVKNNELRESKATQISELSDWIANQNTEIFSLKAEYRSLQATLDSNGAECLDCGVKNYIYEAVGYTREDIERKRDLCNTNINFHVSKVIEYEKSISSLKNELNDNEGVAREYANISTTRELLAGNIYKLEKERNDSDALYGILNQQLLELENTPLQNSEYQIELDKANADLVTCEKALEKGKVELAQTNSEIDNILFWNKELGTEGFYAFIANKCLSFIEFNINKYLQIFDKDLSIKINGTTTLQSDETRNKIDISVFQSGVETAYSGLSKGEQVRLDVCGVLVIQQLINANAANKINGGGFKCLVLDELFEGLDNKGQNSVIHLLRAVNQLVVFITHLQSESTNAERWVVIKDEQGSKLKVA